MVECLTDTPPEVRPWQELVEAGRAAVQRLGDAKWELGDLAVEAAPIQTPGYSTTGADERLREFAEEIGLPFNTLRGYRAVAAKWPPDERQPSLHWTAHRELLKAEDPQRAMQEILTLDPPNGRRWTVAAIAKHIGKPVWGTERKTTSTSGSSRPARHRPLQSRSEADHAVENLCAESAQLRNWLAGANLNSAEKANLAEALDEALQCLREARKRLI